MSDRLRDTGNSPLSEQPRDPLLDLSDALAAAGIVHKVKVDPCGDEPPLLSIEGIVRFPSVAEFAAACTSTGHDAVYNAGSGWTFVTSRAEYLRRSDETYAAIGKKA